MGPHTFNFELICERLAGAGGLRRVADADELADAVGFLLADEVGRYAMTLDAARVARAEAHVLDAIMHALEPLLAPARSEEHTSELQSLIRIPYAVFCLKKQNHT